MSASTSKYFSIFHTFHCVLFGHVLPPRALTEKVTVEKRITSEAAEAISPGNSETLVMLRREQNCELAWHALKGKTSSFLGTVLQ